MRIAKPTEVPAGDHPLLNDGVQHVIEVLQRLRFGVIQLTVHDGKLMQVDVTERRRFGN
ncbi:MAG TPA: YezD family protein [Novosphingobium sp.]|nr:YezD family protein [Novosphingobium sp.]